MNDQILSIIPGIAIFLAFALMWIRISRASKLQDKSTGFYGENGYGYNYNNQMPSGEGKKDKALTTFVTAGIVVGVALYFMGIVPAALGVSVGMLAGVALCMFIKPIKKDDDEDDE